jgi:hypothetical protein
VKNEYVDSPCVTRTYTLRGFDITLPGYIESIDIVTSDYETFSSVIEGETGSGDKIYTWYVDGVEQANPDNQGFLVLPDLIPNRVYRLFLKVKKGEDGREFSSGSISFTIPE